MKLKYRKTKMKYAVAERFQVMLPELADIFNVLMSKEVPSFLKPHWVAGRVYDRDGRVHLSCLGLLTVMPGEVWDGASGPTRDSKKSSGHR